MNDATQGGLVLVPVPDKRVLAVYALLTDLERSAATPAASSALSEEEPVEVTWSVEDLRRFAATPTTTSVTIGKVLDVLAQEPGRYFSTTELEEQTGVPRSNLKGAFAALTRHINKHYGGRGWMLTFKWGSHLGPGHLEEAHYTLSDDQADRWKEARASD